MKKIQVLVLILIFPLVSSAQYVDGSFGNGLTIVPKDSSFSMKFSTRFQTLYAGTYDLDSDSYSDNILIRRARLKFDGYVFNPKVNYKIELWQSNRDTGGGGNNSQFRNTANIILDAVVKYKFAKGWEVWYGQTKLPGNRERVISSQKLQLVDRSLVNSRYNIDRDVGIQLHHKGKIGNGVLKEALAITNGEGRNVAAGNIGGYSYTGRLEYLPMGDFTSKGDYFGSDLKRESSGKLSIGVTYNFNDDTGRTGGQLGTFLADSTGAGYINDLSVVFVDLMYKNNGFSLHSEYANKWAKEQVIAPVQAATGMGFMAMAG